MAGQRNGKPPQGSTRIGTIGEVGDKLGAFSNMLPHGTLLAIPRKELEWARTLPVYIHPNRGATAGWAGGNWISLNEELITRREDMVKTFLHEVAHVIADHQHGMRCSHGYEWRCACIGLGHDRSRTHNYSYIQKTRRARNVVYACTGCDQEYRQTRPLKNESQRFCHVCRSPITRVK